VPRESPPLTQAPPSPTIATGPGQEGQLTPVSRAAAARATNGSSDVPLLLRPLPQDAPAASQPRANVSPEVKALPPVPSFEAVAQPAPAPIAASAPATGPTMSPPKAAAPSCARADDHGPRTPGSAVRRTGLGGTPRRIKSPFPRAPGLAGTPMRVPVAPSPQKTPASAGKGAAARIAMSAERIAASAVGGDGAIFTPGGTRLWQDAGGVGREAGEDDVMAQAQEEGEEEDAAEGGGGGQQQQGEEEPGCRDRAEEEPGSPVRETTTPSKMTFTPGGRLRAALSPIPQEDEEESEEAGGHTSRRGSEAGAADDEEGGEVDEGGGGGRVACGFLQAASTSTPGKEYHVRKTCLGGTPVRLAVAAALAGGEEEVSSPVTPGGSIITRVGAYT